MPSTSGNSDADRVDAPHFTEADIAQLSDRSTRFPFGEDGLVEAGAAKDARRQHAENVREARDARRATGYKVTWRIGWAQLVGWLLFAAIMIGVLVLLLHHLPAPRR